MSGMLSRKMARQLTSSTSTPPTNGPRIGRNARRAGPDAKGTTLLLALEARGQDGQRSGHEDRARRALEEPREDEHLEVGREPAQHGGHAEADQADDEQPPPAEEVGQRAGQDEQRAERQQVAVLDVVLPLQHVDEQARLPADRGQRDGQHGRVEEDDARAEHRGHERPALVGGHRGDPTGGRWLPSVDDRAHRQPRSKSERAADPERHDTELSIAIDAARRAGRLQMERYERLERIVHKSEHDVVTEVDEMSELLIISTIREAFPHDGFLAEESGADRGRPARG